MTTSERLLRKKGTWLGERTWNSIKAMEQNRQCWAESATVLCARWRDEKR